MRPHQNKMPCFRKKLVNFYYFNLYNRNDADGYFFVLYYFEPGRCTKPFVHIVRIVKAKCPYPGSKKRYGQTLYSVRIENVRIEN